MPPQLSHITGFWKNFNNFIIKLDRRPKDWEQGVSWYASHLFKHKFQSSTIKSYISAIKATLMNDDYPWDDGKVMFNTIINSCSIVNDVVQNKLPIQNGLLEMLLFELERKYSALEYHEKLYKAFFCVAHYGMFRMCELAKGSHTLLAKDIHSATGKKKIINGPTFIKNSWKKQTPPINKNPRQCTSGQRA